MLLLIVKSCFLTLKRVFDTSYLLDAMTHGHQHHNACQLPILFIAVLQIVDSFCLDVRKMYCSCICSIVLVELALNSLRSEVSCSMRVSSFHATNLGHRWHVNRESKSFSDVREQKAFFGLVLKTYKATDFVNRSNQFSGASNTRYPPATRNINQMHERFVGFIKN